MLKFLFKISSIAALTTPLVIPNTAIAMPNDPDLYCFQVLPNGQVANLQGLCTRLPEAKSGAKPEAKPAVKSGAQAKTNTESYPPVIAQSFVNSCARTASKSVCTCAFKKMESRYSLSEFIQMAGSVRTGQKLPSEVLSLVSSCVVAKR